MIVTTRMTPERKRQLKQAAEALGLSLTAYLRRDDDFMDGDDHAAPAGS